MDSSQQHDERELEVIREEMERKRADLADKLGALESQVMGTVQSATEAVGDVKEVVASVKDTISQTATTVKDTVTDTVSSVKDAVSDTVSSVADTLNVSRHVENYPWAAMGCAVATGFVGGLLLGGSREDEKSSSDGFSSLRGAASAAPRPAASSAPAVPPASSGEATGGGLGSQLMDSLGDAFGRLTGGLQGLAVGSVMGLVRQMAQSSLPQSLVSDVSRFIDDVSDKLGGKTTELSRSVVDYVSEAVSSSPKEESDAPATQQQLPGAPAAARPPQRNNGPRPRAGSR